MPPTPQAQILAEKPRLLPLLEALRQTVEELLLAGLTAASKSTVERIDATFREVSRMRLLRLGSTLRIANEEITRFNAGSENFSPRRLAFFLGRTWLLASALERALDSADEAALTDLLAMPTTTPVKGMKFVTLGVGKRVAPGAFAAFEFRLRALEPAGPVEQGGALVWSCVFPMRKDLDLPAEAFLHLPQKQKFRPSMLLDRNVIEVTSCALATVDTGPARLMLGEASELSSGEAFTDWASLASWDLAKTAERVTSHRPTPLDLEIELQEEVIVENWQPGAMRSDEEEHFDTLPLQTPLLTFDARLDRGPAGEPTAGLMKKLAKEKQRPPIFGTMHYEDCRLILQPLTALEAEGPRYLTVSPDKISQAQLVKAMKFT